MKNPNKIITVPFASQGDKAEVGNNANPNVVNYPQGYSQNFELPLGAGGQAIQRQGLNGLLFDITDILKFFQYGNRPTFDKRVAEAGGYEQGAILSYYPDPNDMTKCVDLISTKENNTDNFIDNSNVIGSSWIPYNQGIIKTGQNENGKYFLFGNNFIFQMSNIFPNMAIETDVPKTVTWNLPYIIQNKNNCFVLANWQGRAFDKRVIYYLNSNAVQNDKILVTFNNLQNSIASIGYIKFMAFGFL